jgi:L-fuculose-phosphate aldolase
MVETNLEFAAKLALSCNILAQEGHSDMTLGHVSARLPGQDYLHMNPYALDLGEVKGEDIVLIDLEGNQLAGTRRRRTEYPIHTEIYKCRPEINCVIHTHPLYATVLGANGGKIHPISHEGALFLNSPLFEETTELIRLPAQGEALARCLGKARAALLRNHGVVVAGQSIEEATIYAILLEKAARIELLAKQAGVSVWSSEEESRHKVEQIYHPRGIQNFWEFYVRRLQHAKTMNQI